MAHLDSCYHAAIKEGAEELLAEKRVVSGAVNIRTNREKMKVRRCTRSGFRALHAMWRGSAPYIEDMHLVFPARL